MWLIAGLGNPGAKYELTRHNFGFLVIDALLERAQEKNYLTKFNSQVSRIDIEDLSCVLLKPQTFMNRSGQPVQAAMSFHKINLDQIIIIHDELDLPLGELRIKRGGSDGGHNGLKDITRLLGPNYIRLRLGIGRPNFKGTEADYVLNQFTNQEFAQVEQVLPLAISAVDGLVKHGLDFAQQNCQLRSKKA